MIASTSSGPENRFPETSYPEKKPSEIRSAKDMPLEFNYHLLRYALDEFGVNISQLNSEQYQKAFSRAKKSYELESKAISSPEAESVHVSGGELEQAVLTLSKRYNSEEEFITDLHNNFLDLATLKNALKRELTFDRIMQQVASDSPQVKAVDIELFYEMHRNRFETPEKRDASHILITINPDFPENTRDEAFKKITQIAQEIANSSKTFSDLAKRYSECPSAMEGGKLGEVSRGQLYPELDRILFKLNAGEISTIVESEVGFHILYCKKILARKSIPLSQVTEKIKQTLQARYLHSAQKSWLDNLSS